MKRQILFIALGLCGVLATYPSLVWLTVRLSPIDDRWLTVVTQTSFTLPLALALAAVLLSIHGLRVNADYQTDAAEEYREMRERELAAVGAPEESGDRSGTSVSAPNEASASADRYGRISTGKKQNAKAQLRLAARRHARRVRRNYF